MPTSIEYVFDGESSLELLRSRLRNAFRLRPEKRARTLVFHDTFDWRLYAKGWLLEVEQLRRGDYRAICRARTNGRVFSQSLDKMPEHLSEWPQGPLRELLAETAGPRELVPVATLRGRREHYSVLGQDDKIISHLSIDDWHVCRGSRRLPDPPRNRILISPLKGWENETETETATDSLSGLGVRPASRTLLESALLRTGRKPLDYSSKLTVRLSTDQDAAQSLRTILLYLLDTMRVNEAGMKQDIDTEFLHDFRVAVRRTRTVLAQVKGVFQPDSTAWFRNEFAWLGGATGPKRDLDVHLLEFDSQKAVLPPELREDLEPLRGFLKEKQSSEREALNRLLAGKRYRTLLREWQRFLETDAPDVDGPAARRPAREVADERIWKLFRKVVKQGRAVNDQSPPEDLHELRKTCKKLRYLMEFFSSLYPSSKVRKTIKQLKRLQDNLGDYQDQAVQMDALRRYAQEMSGEAADPKVLLAIGALIERIADRHTETRAAFSTRFERFTRKGNRRLFAGLFKPAEPRRDSVEDSRALQH